MTATTQLSEPLEAGRRRRAPLVRRTLVFALLRGLAPFHRVLLLPLPGFEALRWRVGRWRAWRVAELARRRVPAYREALRERGDPRVTLRGLGLDPDLSALPVLDKETYARRHPIEAQCLGGALPRGGVVVDESSGTSGAPNNWVRGRAERAAARRSLQASVRHAFGDEPLFVLNAFALGPWATGMNVSMSLADVTILKSIGPDAGKIARTLELFGPRYRYLVCGYPPFLKALADHPEIDWSRYHAVAVYGGEGVSEGLRDYLGRAFRSVLGSYGASDLEINIAAETDFTVALRRRLAGDERLRDRLVRPGAASSLPLVFQFNPVDYAIETSEEGDLVVTVCRPSNIAPKVRYDIHDAGHVVRFPELRRALAEVGIAVEEIGRPRTDLPLLFLYGRADDAVPFYGSKVTPANVEEVLYSLPDLAPVVSSFCLEGWEDEKLNRRLTIAIELAETAQPPVDSAGLRERVLRGLEAVNQDYREVARIVPAGLEPGLDLHPFGTGPFAGGDIRLKKRYIRAR